MGLALGEPLRYLRKASFAEVRIKRLCMAFVRWEKSEQVLDTTLLQRRRKMVHAEVREIDSEDCRDSVNSHICVTFNIG